jgi:hypothetical protein
MICDYPFFLKILRVTLLFLYLSKYKICFYIYFKIHKDLERREIRCLWVFHEDYKNDGSFCKRLKYKLLVW